MNLWRVWWDWIKSLVMLFHILDTLFLIHVLLPILAYNFFLWQYTRQHPYQPFDY